jgi:hypothetical protein
MFKFTNLNLVNDFFALDHVDALLDDVLTSDNESYVAGVVLYEQEQEHLERANLLEDNYKLFKELDLFEQAIYVKQGVEKYGI